MFTDVAVYVILIVVSVLSIAFFLIGYFGASYSVRTDQDANDLIQKYALIQGEEEIQLDKNWKSNLPAYMITFYQTIENIIQGLFVDSLIFALSACAGFLLIIAVLIYIKESWLLPKGTFWGFFIAFVWGALITGLIAYFFYQVKQGTVWRLPLKERVADILKYCYGNGLIIGLLMGGVISISIFCVTLAIISTSSSHFALEMAGFPCGVILCSIFFRDSLSSVGRGVALATDLIIKKDQYISEIGNTISYTSKVGIVLSSIIDNTSFFDALISTALYFTAPFLVFVYAEEYTYAENYLGKMFGLQLIFILSWVGSFAVACLIGVLNDQDGVAFTAKNIRLQIMISSLIGIGLSVLTLQATFITFDFGLKDSPLALKILNPRVLGCAFMGIIIGIVLLGYFEYLTSHGYAPVQNISKSAEQAPTLNILNGYQLAYMGQIFPVLIIAIAIYVSYMAASMVGFLALCNGLIMNLLILIPIHFSGATSSEALKCAYLAQLPQALIDNLSAVSWAARNYTVWLKIATSLIIIVNAIIVIACMFFMHIVQLIPLGLLIGGGLSQYNRGLAIYIIKVIAEEGIKDEKLMQTRRYKHNELEAMEDISYDYYSQKGRISNYYTVVNLGFTLVIVIFNGVLFGKASSVSLAIGYTLVSCVTYMSSIITQGALKNARIFSSYDEKYQINSQVLASNLYADLQASAMEETNTHYLMIVGAFIFFSVLFFIIAYKEDTFAIHSEQNWDTLRKQYEILYSKSDIERNHRSSKIATLCYNIQDFIINQYLDCLYYVFIANFTIFVAAFICYKCDILLTNLAGLVLGLFIGGVLSCLMVYFSRSIQIGTTIKVITRNDPLRWGYGNGLFLSLFLIGITLLCIIVLQQISHLLNCHMEIPFLLGWSISTYIQRESSSLIGRQLVVYSQDTINGYMLADVHVMDFMAVLILYFVMPSLLPNFVDIGKIYIVVLILNYCAQFLLSFFISSLQHEDMAVQSAQNIRLQIIASSLCSIIALGMLSTYDTQLMSLATIGLIASLVIIIYVDYVTNHTYPLIRSVSASAILAPVLNILSANYLGDMGAYFIILLIPALVQLANSINGIQGQFALLTGFLINAIVIFSTHFAGSSIQISIRIAKIAQLLSNNLQRVSLATSNYSMNLKVTICVSLFLIQTTIIQVKQIDILGVLLGCFIMVINKGINLELLDYFGYWTLLMQTIYQLCIITIIALLHADSINSLLLTQCYILFIWNIKSIITGGALSNSYILEGTKDQDQTLGQSKTHIYGNHNAIVLQESTSQQQILTIIVNIVFSLFIQHYIQLVKKVVPVVEAPIPDLKKIFVYQID